jgi:hypothetical protein
LPTAFESGLLQQACHPAADGSGSAVHRDALGSPSGSLRGCRDITRLLHRGLPRSTIRTTSPSTECGCAYAQSTIRITSASGLHRPSTLPSLRPVATESASTKADHTFRASTDVACAMDLASNDRPRWHVWRNYSRLQCGGFWQWLPPRAATPPSTISPSRPSSPPTPSQGHHHETTARPTISDVTGT